MRIIKIVAAVTAAAVLVCAGALGLHALLGPDRSAINANVDKPKESEAVLPPAPRPLPLQIPAAVNAIRYPEGKLAPQAKDYVSHQPTGESRAYVEFDLRSLSTPPDYAEFVFKVSQHNLTNLPDQTIHVYGYKGDGIIGLDDWQTEGTYLGMAGPFAGYTPLKSDRGGGKPGGEFRFDITGLLSDALASKSRYVGFYFRNPTATKLNHTDPLGYSALLRVGGFQITFPEKP